MTQRCWSRRPSARRSRLPAFLTRASGALAALLVLLTAGASGAAAPEPFEPYVPPAAGQVSAPLYVIIAYAAIWLGVTLFLVSIWRRQRRVTAELEQLKREQD
jgi:CcmD family protein